MAERIQVEAPGGGYPIIVEPGVLNTLGARAEEFGLKGKIVIVTNVTIIGLYGDIVAKQLYDSILVSLPDGEQYKTLNTVAKLYNDFISSGLDRSGIVMALGGGVVGDTAGFAAATFLRGVHLIQVPTTLLSMVDSSVGGKVGVDLPQGKNLVGAFKQPDMVLIDPLVLRTLPDREWGCGLAEVIKHGLLADEGLLDPSFLKNANRAPELVRRAVQVKVDIVQQDPLEQNIRAYLNLGHTFAQAIEQASGYNWLHGEAVAVGLLAAAKLSHALGISDKSLPNEVYDILGALGLPRKLGWMKAEDIYTGMGTDKKRKGGKLRFVLLRDFCQPLIVEDVPKSEVIKVLEGLK